MSDNFIMKKSSCISNETCEYMIDFFNNNESVASKGRAGKTLLDDLEIPINVYQFHDNLVTGLNDTIEKYKEKYPLINTHLGKWQVDSIAQLMRYEPGDVYNLIHCETGVYNPYRIFAWMIYLNTIEDGGGTEFLHFNKTLRPKAGDMYIWPAGWTHLHRGVVAPHERKYLLTGWVSHLTQSIEGV
jgi:hypothetical protein